MTKRALKRLVREGEFDTAQFHDDGKIRRLPVERGWSPLSQAEEHREQSYLKTIRPKSPGQARLLEAIDAKNLVLALGPAGSGKTYLAIAKAVEALEAGRAGRIVLSRPAVEAGESIGFLPGEMEDKLAPYLRPLYDALQELLEDGTTAKYLERGTVEVAPLAYMRGRTLNDAFIILDEAQNTTPEQMKMFLTRLGFGSKVVVTGDITQIDLPDGQLSGLRIVQQILDEVEDVHFAHLTSTDVVRHRLVTDIVDAYARWDAGQQASPAHPVPSRSDRRRRR